MAALWLRLVGVECVEQPGDARAGALSMLRLRFITFSWLSAMSAWLVGQRLGTGELPSSAALTIGSPLVLLIVSLASAPVFSRLEAVVRLARDVEGPRPEELEVPLRRGDELARLRRILLEVRRRQADTSRQLLSQQNLSARIIDGMQEGVMLVDAGHRVRTTNPALREMLLLRPDCIGKPLMEVVRHADLDTLLGRVGKEPTITSELELTGLLPRRVLVSASALGGTDGAILLVFVDVTALRQLENLRRDFVANVSHELRTPVTSILSGAETLRSVIAVDPRKAEPFVDIVERNAERLRLLIEDLLDLSRIEGKALALTFEPLRLAGVTRHVLSLFQERAAKREIRLVCEIDEDLSVLADRRALEQVLTNLVENAVKYGRQSGTVSVRAEIASLPPRGHATSKISLSVLDDGPGITAEHLPRLFERFYRVDAGRTREHGGTGLGLAIAKHLVEAMHGSIGASSTEGEGTRFEILLPRAV